MINLILLDEHNESVGYAEKLFVHRMGLKHKAFSVFIIDSKSRVLMQKRAQKKYHSPSEWSNTCCGHPRIEKNEIKEACSRLYFEMGIKAELHFAFHIEYLLNLENSMIENEYDSIYIGYSEDVPDINTDEVSEYRWMSIKDINNNLSKNLLKFTPWFVRIYPLFKKYINYK